ncbi:MAG: hypothetical protein H7A33_03565 [Deltaproteobacteria bacterium]|nr:hypothetical protein [Deltaproteobacteria bacterium]
MKIKPAKKISKVSSTQVETKSKENIFERMQLNPADSAAVTNSDIEFVRGKIFFQGNEIFSLLQTDARFDPTVLSLIASHVKKFKNKQFKKRSKSKLTSLKEFLRLGSEREFSEEEIVQGFAICDAVLERVSQLMQINYQNAQDGLRIHFDEQNHFILNGLNVDEFVLTLENEVNEKSRVFAKGLKARLELALQTKRQSPNFEKIQTEISRLLSKINQFI